MDRITADTGRNTVRLRHEVAARRRREPGRDRGDEGGYRIDVEATRDGHVVRLSFDGLEMTYGPYRSIGYAAAQADHLRELLRSGQYPPARHDGDVELMRYHVARLRALVDRLDDRVTAAGDEVMRAALQDEANRIAAHARDLAGVLGAE